MTTNTVLVGASTVTLGMDSDSMGVNNAAWGNDQRWHFSFDQDVSFDALTFFGNATNYAFESTAWKDDANTSGSNWTFTSDGTTGTFTFTGPGGAAELFDFSSAGVANVIAGTEIRIYTTGGSTGGQMQSFTITPVPEASTFVILLAGVSGLCLIRRRA